MFSRPHTGAARELEAQVESIAQGGNGVLRLDSGEVILVPGVLAGERIRLAVTTRGGKASGRTLAIVESSPERVAPSCPIRAACGGCDLMHASPAEQARIHAAIVEGRIGHAAHQAKAPSAMTVGAVSRSTGETTRYRSRARFHFEATPKSRRVGYFAANSHDLVDVEDCAVVAPALLRAARDVVGWLSPSTKARGEIAIALGWHTSSSGERPAPVIELTVDRDPSPSFYAALDRATREGVLAGARVTLGGSSEPMVFGDPRPVQLASDGEPLVLAAGGFAQPSDAGARLLASRVGAIAAPAGKHILELYAGSGTLSVELARGAASFASVEESGPAVECARANLARRGLSGKLRIGDAGKVDLPRGLDLVVLDPPRTGAFGVAEALARARPREIVYVSCDPATLARDLVPLFAAGYVTTLIETVELFPQTSHVETIVAMVRPRKTGS